MINRTIGIITAALSFAVPLTSFAAPIQFDRNKNAIPDITFNEIVFHEFGHGVVLFDNDEDGKNDFGFVEDTVIVDELEIHVINAMWIDKNGDGKIGKKEVKMLPHVLPWATFPTDYALKSESDGKNGITHFMDYTDDAVVAHEVGHDINGDGDLERDAFHATSGAIGEGMADVLALVDTDNDGFFDLIRFLTGSNGELMTETATFKPLQKHLPVMHYPQ